MNLGCLWERTDPSLRALEDEMLSVDAPTSIPMFWMTCTPDIQLESLVEYSSHP